MTRTPLTELLVQYSGGRRELLAPILRQVYPELRRLAESYLRHERPGHTLQPSALVNEAFLRLVELRAMEWNHRSQFFGAAAGIMRRVLVDHARAKLAQKRGARAGRQEFSEAELAAEAREITDVLDVDRALSRLQEVEPRLCRVVELRYFTGMSLPEIAEATGTSISTVQRDWAVAKAWLFRELGQEEKKRAG